MNHKIMNRLKNCRIRTKIIYVYGVYIFGVLIALIISVILILYNVILNNVKIPVINNSQVIISQIEEKVKNAESCANIMLGYLNELDFLRKNGKQEIGTLKKHNQVLKMMTYAYRVFQNVDGMVFIDNDGNIYGDNNTMEEICLEHYPTNLILYMKTQGGKAVWFNMNKKNSLSKEKDGYTLTMGKNIVDISSGENLGVLFITISEKSINKVSSSLRLSENSYYVITNKKGMVVSSPNSDEIGKQYSLKKNTKQSELKGYYSNGYYMYIRSFNKLPYNLTFHAPIKELTKDSTNIILYIMIIGAACILIAAFLSDKLAGKITKPIISLSEAMNLVSTGDMSVRCRITTGDETKLIGDGFNTMLDKIQELIQKINREQKDKRIYELALIQSQIKPHFLYNVLDTIFVLAHMGRSEDVKKMSKALAEFYRVSLSSGKDIITIGEEIKCIQDYLKIQGIRYAEEFTYEINVDESINQNLILKLSIQPLVENAIYHGLKEMAENGLLKIYSEFDDSNIWIYVNDNGVGMDEEKCIKLLTEETKASFGIKNLNDRIHLYFGEEYGLKISSKKNEGTTVVLHIPRITGGLE